MKINQIITLTEAINSLVKLDKDKGIKLSGATRMKIAANLRLLSDNIKDFQDVRNSLIESLGSPTDGGGFEVKPDSPGASEFEAQSKDMLNTDRCIKIETITKDNLFGSSPDADKQNQVPMDIVAVFLETGLLLD